ncbi:tyrosine--tRNA ligase [Natrinema hispanicum]|uniref:Tyrosine--tRNA ligase n=1 Tax=Natrinema hispanicum TaxID=392421 RepID=A0A1G6WZT2_9EURY|nr:tyrosine--tRNA ligase [Natrinema hispanicum]SDD71304.1 tyrosyl-tRNA synthetase [Natrinema hispanicum]SEU07448.1 tyrosyl-tRNA synthetase [Natrinema hispanicum]
MNTYELLTRNTVEVVTEQEVRELANDPADKRVYVGYEPSGVLHLGHLLTANKLIDLQEAGMDVVVLLADVHAHLNGKGSFEEIHEMAERMKAQFVAYGLDEDKTEYVYGSDFQLETYYSLDLHELGVSTTLNRAQRAVAELQSGETATVSHTVYPLMQVLDFEFLGIDLAVGGTDQRKVHMLAREKLPELGYKARPCLHTPILANLETGEGKMSSSEGTTISMEDSTADLERKIKSAFCPPTHDPEGDRENPVLQLFEYYVFPRFESVTVRRPEKYGGNRTYERYDDLTAALESGELHPEDAKETVAGYLDELIAPGREKLRDLTNE